MAWVKTLSGCAPTMALPLTRITSYDVCYTKLLRIWEMDKRGRFTYLSPKFEDISGYSPAEFIGKKVLDMLPEDSALQNDASIRALMERPCFSLETAAIHKSGHRYMVEVRGVSIFDAAGNLQGLRGITRDCTERWQLTQRNNFV